MTNSHGYSKVVSFSVINFDISLISLYITSNVILMPFCVGDPNIYDIFIGSGSYNSWIQVYLALRWIRIPIQMIEIHNIKNFDHPIVWNRVLFSRGKLSLRCAVHSVTYLRKNLFSEGQSSVLARKFSVSWRIRFGPRDISLINFSWSYFFIKEKTNKLCHIW